MDNPLISVIIPCYNCEAFVGEAIQSVLNQTYQNFEIICIDDGSTDDTVKTIELIQKKDQRISLIRQDNQGGNFARNEGLKNAKGSLIQFLDADDVLRKNKFSSQVSLFTEEIDWVVCNYEIRDADLKNVLKTSNLSGIITDPLTTVICKIIITNNPLYRKQIVNEIGGYNINLKRAQDWEFHIRLVNKNKKIAFCDSILFFNRQLSHSVSSNWIKVTGDQLDIINKNDSLIKAEKLTNGAGLYITLLHFNWLVNVKTTDFKLYESNLKKLYYWHSKFPLELKFIKKLVLTIFGLRTLVKLTRLGLKLKK